MTKMLPTFDTDTKSLPAAVNTGLKRILVSGTILASDGIDPTGSADSTSAIQALLNSGGVIYGVPGATYKVATLTVPSGSKLIGNGATINFTGSTAGSGCLTLTNVSQVEVTGWNFTGALTTIAVKAIGSSQIKVRDNTATTIGIFTSVSASDAYSTSSEGECRNIEVTSNRATAAGVANGYAAICLRYTSDSVVSNNRITGYGHGIMWWGGDSGGADNSSPTNIRKAQRLTITGNTVASVGGGGIWGSMGRTVTVTGNAVKDCGDVGIDLEGTHLSTVTGNTVENCVNGGLTTFYACLSCVFSGNTVVQPTTGTSYPCFAALTSNTSKRITVTGNVFLAGAAPLAVIFSDQGGIGDSLFASNDITTASTGVEAARFNQCDRIKFMNNTVRVAHHTGVGHYGGVDSQYQGNHMTTTADSSSVGTGGGVRFTWINSTESSQRIRVRDNVFIGFVTGVMDDCGGDNASLAAIENNQAAAIWHRGTTGYYGRISNNFRSDNVATPITAA